MNITIVSKPLLINYVHDIQNINNEFTYRFSNTFFKLNQSNKLTFKTNDNDYYWFIKIMDYFYLSMPLINLKIYNNEIYNVLQNSIKEYEELVEKKHSFDDYINLLNWIKNFHITTEYKGIINHYHGVYAIEMIYLWCKYVLQYLNYDVPRQRNVKAFFATLNSLKIYLFYLTKLNLDNQNVNFLSKNNTFAFYLKHANIHKQERIYEYYSKSIYTEEYDEQKIIYDVFQDMVDCNWFHLYAFRYSLLRGSGRKLKWRKYKSSKSIALSFFKKVIEIEECKRNNFYLDDEDECQFNQQTVPMKKINRVNKLKAHLREIYDGDKKYRHSRSWKTKKYKKHQWYKND